MRVVVVPRWGGTSKDDWYPWIACERSGVVVLDLPDPGTPRVDVWPPRIAEALGDGRDTIAVGHSVGCQALLRALALRSGRPPLRAVLCVAGWWSVDAPWATIVPWMQSPDLDAARRGAESFDVLLSTNDPFTADHEANAALWRTRLGATVTIVPDARHFNDSREPVVVEALDRLLARS